VPAIVGRVGWVICTLLDVGVVELVEPLEHEASTTAPNASAAPSRHALLSQGRRCMWLSRLPDLNEAVDTGSVPLLRETAVVGTVAHP
jgi:hypothetical protein